MSTAVFGQLKNRDVPCAGSGRTHRAESLDSKQEGAVPVLKSAAQRFAASG